MDYRLMKSIIFKRWHIVAMLLLVIVFIIGAYWIRQNVNKQSDILSRSIIHGSTVGYQKFLNSYFSNYDQTLKQVGYVFGRQLIVEKEKQAILNSMLNLDSSIVAVGVLEHSRLLKVQSECLVQPLPDMLDLLQQAKKGKTSRVYMEQYLFVSQSEVLADSCVIGIFIDLHRLHKQFICDNIYTSMYQVVINQHGRCIYHPEIKNIGKPYALPDDLFNNEQYDISQMDALHVAQSEYLQLPVFKEYSLMDFRNEAWLVINISPGFEVKDMVADQERNLFLLFLLFLTMLLIIIVFSIVNWKSEFLLRASTEQEHLNLLLKHEKQKSETISIKLELLRSGLNSHFMFNSLATAKALLRTNANAARDMLTDLSQLYRYQLSIEGEQMVTLQEELDFTLKYVDVINLRSNSSIDIKLANLNEYLEYKVLPVSLQLLVENCIKHNIASEAWPLTVLVKVHNGRISVVNELRPKEAIGESSGKGLKNLNTRYKLITQQECSFNSNNGHFIATMPLIN